MVLWFCDFPSSPHQEMLGGGDASGSPGSRAPLSLWCKQDTKKHNTTVTRTKAISTRRCFYLQDRSDVRIQFPPRFWGLCHHGRSWPNTEPLRSLMQASGKMTAHDICRSLHLPCSHCWTKISIEKQIRVRTLPGMLPITGASSGERCFLFGPFQIGKLYKVHLRQSDRDCRDCLFPVLARS